MEGDASSASYFLAAALLVDLLVKGCGTESLQGDLVFGFGKKWVQMLCGAKEKS